MHPLQTEIARLRRRACRLGWVQGSSRFAAVAVGAILLWCVFDVLVRSHEVGIRVIGFVSVLATGLYAAWRFVWPLITWRLSDIEVAKIVDRRFSPTANRVASAFEFLQLATAIPSGVAAGLAGSALLRQAVVTRTGEAVANAKLDDVLDRRPTVRAITGAIAMLALAGVFAALSPAEAQLAFRRLVTPTAELPWPPRHQLAFEPVVSHLSQGDPFEIRVLERDGNLPDQVWIEYAELAQNGTAEQPNDSPTEPPPLDAADSRTPMQRQGDAMVARRENVRASFWYRAVGGDDVLMPWRKLTVVEPPALATCQITVRPPEYTGWPPDVSPRAIRALADSTVSLEATSNRPLRKAAVLLESGRRIPLSVDEAGLKISLAADSWTIDDSRYYQFELTARDGTRTSATRDERWEIQPIVDLPPVATIERPAGVVYATPQGRVQIRLSATDDLAMAEVRLARSVRRQHQDNAAAAVVPAVETIGLADPNAATAALARWPREDRLGPLDVKWILASFKAEAGDTIEYEAIAIDRKGQEARSPIGRILVISREEFIERASDQQLHIAEQLLRATDLARQTQRALAGLSIKARQSGSLAEDDRDALSSLETEHRQVVRLLTEPQSGVAPLCETLLADLESNDVELPDRNRRVKQIGDELRRLEREEFGPLDRALAEVWTVAPAAKVAAHATEAARLAAAFAVATTRHDRVVASLVKLHESLSQWDNVRRVAREIAEIQRIEQGAASRVTELARTTLGQRIEDLPADSRAEVAQLVETQRDLRRRLDRAQSRMDKLLATLELEDAHAAGLVTDALDYLAKTPIGGLLSAAADEIAANRLGQAAQSQAKAIASLGELLTLLNNRPEADPERIAKRLAAAAERLEKLRAEFGGLGPDVEHAGAISNYAQRRVAAERIDQKAAGLAKQLAALSREIVRLDALPPAERVASAALGVRSIAKLVAEQPATAVQSRDAIEKDLTSAARLLAAHARQLAAERIRAELISLSGAVAGLLQRQEMLLAESKAFQHFANSATQDAWKAATADAIERQRMLGEETIRLATTAKVDAFAVLLRVAAEEMGEAATLLDSSRRLSQATDVQRRVVGRLRQVVAATAKPSENPPDVPQPSDPRMEPVDPPVTPDDQIHVIEELRLLRSMQSALNERTISFDARRGSANADDEGKRELAALAAEQQRLAALFRNLFVDPNRAPSRSPEEEVPRPKPPIDDGPSPLGP